MANSIAYVLSKNTYPNAFQANLIGVNQGTQIVYATTSTLTSANILFADSRLTQPIYGDGTSWYGVQLLTNTAVVYPITISESGVIAIGSGTTTTAAPTTTTTTAAPTTTTTAAPGLTLYLSILSSGDACAQTGPIFPITGITFNGGPTLCGSASSLDSNDVDPLSGNTTYYVTDGTDVRQAFKVAGAGVTTLVFTGPCTSCTP
jgi:hypothetical protein